MRFFYQVINIEHEIHNNKQLERNTYIANTYGLSLVDNSSK